MLLVQDLRFHTGSNKMSCLMLKLITHQYDSNENNSAWLEYIYRNLDYLGLSYIRNSQNLSVNQFKRIVKQKLKDQFFQMWSESIHSSSMTVNYRIYKHDLKLESYHLKLPETLWKSFLKFRTCNNNLPVNKARYLDIPRNERLCTLCNSNDIGDEFHYLFICKSQQINLERTKYLKQFYITNPNAYKMDKLFNSKGVSLIKLAKFTKIIQEIFATWWYVSMHHTYI